MSNVRNKNMNTSQFIPYSSVSPNIIINRDVREYPGLYGTGFFCCFPPYKTFFYITARHCVKDLLDPESNSYLGIPFTSGSDKAVRFECVIETNINNSIDEEREDVAVYVVDQKLTEEEYSLLYKRALKLKHQDDVDNMLSLCIKRNDKLRTVGFPTHDHPNCQTEVDYEKNEIKSQPRGFYGTASKDYMFPDQYSLVGTNWKEGEYRGFSGAPVIFLARKLESPKDVVPIPVGVILMASKDIARFLDINIVTNLISSYLRSQIAEGMIEEIPEIFPGHGAY